MLLQVKRDELTNAIAHVSKAVATRTTIPILTGIKLVAHENGLTLTASDSDISIECEIPAIIREGKEEKEIARIEETGSIVIPSRFFGEIIRKLPSEEVTIAANEHLTITIRSEQAEFTLNGMDADEFPRLPCIEEEKVFSMQSDLLKTMIRQTVFAAATTETRPILTGVMWSLAAGKLKFIATDSHRLACREAAVEAEGDLGFTNVVVPGKSLNELAKILDDGQVLADIIVTDNQILVKAERILFYSRLLDGTYPDTSRIIPQSFKTEIVVPAKEFLQALERVSLLAREGKNNVARLVTLEGTTLELSSVSPEIGKVTERLIAKAVEGEELKISFNAKYMLDALRTIDSSEIRIGFTGAMSPFVIKPTDQDGILHLVLPVRTYG
ncbi:DNA polymerase III subunit beta [Bacillaceae bacterium]